MFGTILGLIVAALTFIAFQPALDAGAVMPDDEQYVHANRLVRNPGWDSARRFLTEVLAPSTVGGYYQPLAMISLMFDVALGAGSDNYRTFHATSLALHVACTVLVMLILWSVFDPPWVAAGGALLFGLHPGAVESVAWVSDRKTLLATFFGLASLIAYLQYASAATHHRRVVAYIATIVFFLLAVLSKPTAVMLPLAMILLDLWPLHRFNRRRLLEKVPLLTLAALSSIVTIISQGRTAGLVSATNYPWWAAPLLVTHNVVFYLWKILWPVRLSPYYPWPQPFNLSQPAVVVGLFGSLILAAAVLVTLRRTRAWAVGLGVFFLLLLPGMGLLGFTTTIAADRFAYLPKIGLALIVGWLLQTAWRANRLARLLSSAIMVLVCAGLATSTRAYLSKWRDTEEFFRYQVALAPEAAVLQVSFGNILSGRGKTDEAIAAYQRAIEINDDPNAHAALGSLYGQSGRLDKAVTHYRMATTLNPKDVVSRANLATILDHTGQSEEALREIDIALSGAPRAASPYFHHAMMLFRRNRLNEAAERFQQALARDSDYLFARYQYGCLLMCLGRIGEGLNQWRAAYALRPDWPELAQNLGWVLATSPTASLRNPTEAVGILRRANERSNMSDPALLDALAAACAAEGDYASAVRLAKQCLVLLQARGDTSTADMVRQRLSLYEKGQPYLEAVTPDRYRPR